MVDIHAHILPSIDDGAIDLEESLAMCKMAYEDGIRTVVATPHVGRFPNTREAIQNKAKELKEELNLNLNLLCGADHEFHPDLYSLVENKSVSTINDSRYLLLDISSILMPPNIERQIERLVTLGMIPIIAHPERCMQVQEDVRIAKRMVESGAIIQITASSITGEMGPKARESARLILKNNLAQVIATDTHGINRRPPLLSKAVEAASTIIGKERARAMVTTTPQMIVDNRLVTVEKSTSYTSLRGDRRSPKQSQ